jgi:hypothetical protein
MVFVALRGAIPVDDEGGFADSHDICTVDIDHRHLRCAILQWTPSEGRYAIFPGSTVHHVSYVDAGIGTNLMMSGRFEYRRGMHRAGMPTEHDAFRQISAAPVLRNEDGSGNHYAASARHYNPPNNLHAGWAMGVDYPWYGSAGCQVVAGFPQCPLRDGAPNVGPWQRFQRNAYATEQQVFPYILLTGRDALRAVRQGDASPMRLLFGSVGDAVGLVQKELADLGHYAGRIDGHLLTETHRAVLAFQEHSFRPYSDRPGAVDGVVGRITLEALGVDLDRVR